MLLSNLWNKSEKPRLTALSPEIQALYKSSERRRANRYAIPEWEQANIMLHGIRGKISNMGIVDVWIGGFLMEYADKSEKGFHEKGESIILHDRIKNIELEARVVGTSHESNRVHVSTAKKIDRLLETVYSGKFGTIEFNKTIGIVRIKGQYYTEIFRKTLQEILATWLVKTIDLGGLKSMDSSGLIMLADVHLQKGIEIRDMKENIYRSYALVRESLLRNGPGKYRKH